MDIETQENQRLWLYLCTTLANVIKLHTHVHCNKTCKLTWGTLLCQAFCQNYVPLMTWKFINLTNLALNLNYNSKYYQTLHTFSLAQGLQADSGNITLQIFCQNYDPLLTLKLRKNRSFCFIFVLQQQVISNFTNMFTVTRPIS